MPTHPHNPEPSSDAPDAGASAFGGMGAGLSFFQDWMKAATSAMPHLQAAQGGGAANWAMPTLDPDELDKRIQDLRTVQFWLEQNARLISMTIQGLEVQRMTLSTLRGMNVSMDAVRDSLKARAEAAGEPAQDAQAGASDPAPQEGDNGSAAVNPMRWWDALTQQFNTMASQAVQVAQQAGASTLEAQGEVLKKAQAASQPRPASKKTAAAKTAAPRRRPADSGQSG